MNINDYYSTESSWLKGDDLPAGREVKVTIESIEEVRFDDKQPPKLAIKFVGKDKGVVLNKTNAGRIADVHGFESDNWPGKDVFLYSEPVEFNSQMVRSVRLRVVLPEAEQDSEVPF